MNITNDYILSLLKEPRTRAELISKTKLSDRKVRLAIEELRKNGHCIIHDNVTNTYKLTDDINEIEKFLKVIDSYQTSFYFNYLPMRQKVAKARGQKLVKVRQRFRRLGIEIDESQIRMGI
jgi:hypothetical protein